MKIIYNLVILVISNALALYVADRLIPGFAITSGYDGYLEVGLVLGIMNAFVKPLLKFLSFPVILLSFGLFSLLINIFLLYYTSWLFDFFTISSLWAGLGGLIVISVVNSLIISLFKN